MNGTCRFCSCTEEHACEGGCFWVLPDVCSRCAIEQLDTAGMQTDWLELAMQEYSMQTAIAVHVDPNTPRLWRPGDPI